jgi:hypothetical protein
MAENTSQWSYFTTCRLNLILITAFVLLYLGVLSYKYWFIALVIGEKSLHCLTTLLGAIFSFFYKYCSFAASRLVCPTFGSLLGRRHREFIQGIQFLVSPFAYVSHVCLLLLVRLKQPSADDQNNSRLAY